MANRFFPQVQTPDTHNPLVFEFLNVLKSHHAQFEMLEMSARLTA